MKYSIIIGFLTTILVTVSCYSHKEISSKQLTSQNPIVTETTYKSRVLQQEHELTVEMRSWSCEEIEEFKRHYVYSEVNIFKKNGDKLKIK